VPFLDQDKRIKPDLGMYAIVDIETTGGKFNEEGITEIAIYRHDGFLITDQFCSLVNPERPIQAFVVSLTGINNTMLRQAPKFYEVAKRIVEITEDAVLVAHNAQFDYRILRTEFERLGYDFQRKTLCTVELSKKLLPGHASYSLGKLVRALGIPISDRHRAQGDAQATVKLFQLLLDRDVEKNIVQSSIRLDPKKQIEPKLLELIDQAPTETGVYYLRNQEGKLIYIGKSKNIKKRLTQHFTGQDRKSKN
jgi:DNA polymerase-3 subunit epsilon